MVDLVLMKADSAADPQQHGGIERGIVKFEPTGQQARSHVSAQRMIAAHDGSVRSVHGAQNPGVLFEMALDCRERMLFHEPLLFSENLLRPIE